MKNVEIKVGLGLCTLAIGTILTLAASLPPYSAAAATGYGVDEVVSAPR